MKNRLYLFITIFLCFFLFIKKTEIYAQSIDQDFRKINIDIEGLEVSDITSIVGDKEGYIWMGTDLGLLKYNGYQFLRYKYSELDSTSLNHNTVKTLFVDSRGDLWVGTKVGLNKYNRTCDCFSHFPSSTNNQTPTGIITDIIEDQNNHIWVAVRNGGIFRYEREKNQFNRFLSQTNNTVSLVNDVVHVLLADKENHIWVGTGFGNLGTGLVRFNPSTGNAKRFVYDSSNKSSLLDNRISSLYEDQKGQLFVGTYKCGLHLFNKEKEIFERIEFDENDPAKLHAPYLSSKIPGLGLNRVDPSVEIIGQDQNGGYWIGTAGKGINYFDPITNKQAFYGQENNNFTNLLFRAFCTDSQGGIWVASQGAALYRKDNYSREFKYYPATNNSAILYESPLNLGTIWGGSSDEGLRKINLKTGELTNYLHNKNNDKSIGHNSVRSVYQEDSNTLWIGLGNIGGDDGGEDGLGGLDRLDINSGTFKHYKINKKGDATFSHTVYNVCQDVEGYLWLSTGSGGLFRSDKDKQIFSPYNFPNPDSTSINPVVYDFNLSSEGINWASDAELAGAGKTYQYDLKKNRFHTLLDGFEATNILKDDNGWYWISTWEKGILHFNPSDQTYRQYTTEEGLSSNLSTYIIKGEERDVYWIGTRFGICRLDAKKKRITPLKLPIENFYFGIFKSSDGQIFFSTKNKGLISFYPDQIKGNPFPPKTVISHFLISDIPYKFDSNKSKTISLSHSQNDISIEYAGLHYSNPPKNQHQYKLTPIDDRWVNAGSNLIARYPNLNPGTYRFEVKSANSFGVWNKETTTLDFIIKPAWWKTWWAYLMYAALIGLIVYQTYQVRTRRILLDQQLLFEHQEADRLKEINEFKNTLYTNITHEFRTPLTVIGGMAEATKSNIEKKEFGEANTALDLIQRNGRKLLHLVNAMLDLAKLESGTMKLNLIQADIIAYLKYISESFYALAAEREIHLTVYTEVESVLMDFDVNKMASVFANVLSNAIKFTPLKGTVTVHFTKIRDGEANVFQIKIKDSGVGIDLKDQQNIFSRFYQVDGSTSREQQGTGIGLTLVKELLELMDGTIEVSSKIEKGSTFIVKIPISNNAPIIENPETLDNQVYVDEQITQISLSQNSSSDLPMVLIIEDNQDVVHYLQICLNEKYQTIHAKNGVMGIEMALEKIPDIIISDVMMPEKDGFEVCATLKTNELTDHIPIIMLTAKATVQDRLAGLSYGADAYLTKPFIKEELLTRLEQLILLRQKMFRKMKQKGFTKILKEKTNNSQNKFVRKAIKVIHENIQQTDFNTAQLASRLHISESQLYRKLKATTDKSTAVFIRSIRLKKAEETIRDTDKPISQIAYEVGFNDPSWFSRAFKEEFGISPNELRK